MAGFSMGKMKRKDLEEVYDDFSDFSLNSPARKIRRLDAELPPIMEEEEPAVPFPFDQQMPKDPSNSSAMAEFGSVMAEDLPSIPLNEERALVLYKPMNSPLALSRSSSNISLTMNSDFIHGLKNQAFWPGNPNPMMVEELPTDDKPGATRKSLAMVPWMPSQSLSTIHGMDDPESRVRALEETMESEEVTAEAAASMEVEEDAEQAGSNGATGENFHQWQQHCMTPQIPQNTSTPIMWSWG